MGAVIVSGHQVELGEDIAVHTWNETGLHFIAVPRAKPTRVVINHWTGAENPPDRLFANLRARRLSVHFGVDAQGEVWQYMDAHGHGQHCAGLHANDFSVGIEFICRGNNFGVSNRGLTRKRSFENIHRTKVMYDDLTTAQLRTGVRLNEALCGAFDLPLRVPVFPNGEVFSLTFGVTVAAEYTGCAGHLHYEAKKVDPGLALLRAIQQRAEERQLSRPIA